MYREIGEILSTRVTSDRDYEPAARPGNSNAKALQQVCAWHVGVQVAGELAWRVRGTVGDEISEVSRARVCRALQASARYFIVY